MAHSRNTVPVPYYSTPKETLLEEIGITVVSIREFDTEEDSVHQRTLTQKQMRMFKNYIAIELNMRYEDIDNVIINSYLDCDETEWQEFWDRVILYDCEINSIDEDSIDVEYVGKVLSLNEDPEIDDADDENDIQYSLDEREEIYQYYFQN